MANIAHEHLGDSGKELEPLVRGARLSEPSVALLEKLTSHFPQGGKSRTTLSSSGSDAVETAIKASILKTGRSSILAFES